MCCFRSNVSESADRSSESIQSASGRKYCKSDPTIIQKYSEKDYGSLKAELGVMKGLNKRFSEYVPEIVKFERSGDDIERIEYEYIDDPTLSEHLTGRARNYKITREDWQELTGLIDSIHEIGIAHGDIARDNIMYGDRGWTIYDPAGIDISDPDFEEAKRKDLNNISKLEASLNKNRFAFH